MSDRFPDRAYDDRAEQRRRRKILTRWKRRGVTAAKYVGASVGVAVVLGLSALAGLIYAIYRLVLWIAATA